MNFNNKLTPPVFFLIASLSLLFCYLPHGCDARIDVTAQYDGVTANYNTYINFTGETGIKIEESNYGLSIYTMSLWMKMDRNPWDYGNDMTVITFTPNAFTCRIKTNMKLDCDSDGGASLIVTGQLRLGSWYMLIIKSKSGTSQLQLREQSFNQLSSDSKSSFFPLGYTQLSFSKIYIGIDKDERNYGFFGSLRNFRLLSDFYDDSTIKNYQFIQLYPFTKLQFQILMSTNTDLQNSVGRGKGVFVGRNSNTLPTVKDFNGVWWCWNPGTENFPQFQYLDSSFSFQKYSLPSNYNSANNYDSTLQMWVLRNNVNTGSQSETLFNHDSVLQLTFEQSNFDFLKVTGMSQTSQAYNALFPYNKWIFLQITNTKNYFSVYMADQTGAQILYSDQIAYTGAPIQKSSRDVYISPKFNGIIKAVKYYNTANIGGTPYSMSFETDSNQALMLYFILQPFSYTANTRQFANFAFNNINDKLTISTGSPNFVTWQFFEMNAQPTTGVVTQTTTYDGNSCGDKFEKLYMASTSNYVTSTFTAEAAIASYTMEFWFKAPGGYNQDAILLSLADSSSRRTQYMMFYQEKASRFNCYPFYQSVSDAKSWNVQYQDYTNDKTAWQHIACTYDSTYRSLRGDYYYAGLDYIYTATTPKQQTLPKGTYVVTVNTDPYANNLGMQRSFFSEVRVWRTARTSTQISDYKFHQLYVDKERPKLFSYMKLFNGGFSGASEIDFADSSVSKLLTFSGTQWVTNQDLTVCPQNTFAQVNDKNCYREGVIQLSLTFIRRDNDYIITPFYSRYRNTFLKNNLDDFYQFTWTVLKVDTRNNATDRLVFPTIVDRQSTQQQLTLGFNQVAQNPGAYTVQLKLSDKKYIQNDNIASITFKTLNCLRIFDRDTHLSNPFIDLGSTRGKEDAFVYYDYTECKDYYFQPSLLIVGYDNGQIFNDNDHTASLQRLSIRLAVQNSLPINEYFYLRVTATWQNRYDPSDKISLSMIYSLRYITVLNINLKANYQLLMSSQTLTLTSEGTQVVNINPKDTDPKTYQLAWQCPSKIQSTICSKAGTTLTITNTQFAQSGLNYWEYQNITLLGTTNFVQGNGLNSVSKTIQVIWLPVDPQVTIIGNSRVQSSQMNAYTIAITNLRSGVEQEEIITIKWSITPAVNPQYYLNNDNRKQFVISPGALSEGTTYSIGVQIVYTSQRQVIWSGSKSVYCNRSPNSGSLQVSPVSGSALQTEFKLQANNWNVESGPATYQFYYLGQDGSKIILQSSQSSSLQTALPITKQVFLKVIDSNGAFQTASATVSVDRGSNSTLGIVIDNVASRFQDVTNTPQQRVQLISLFSKSLSLSQEQLGQTRTQELLSKATEQLLSQATNLKSQSSDFQQFFVQSALQSIASMNNNTDLFDLPTIAQQQQILTSIFTNHTSILNNFMVDESINTTVLQTQSNILNNLHQLNEQGRLDFNRSREDIGSITNSLRQILVKYEQLVGLNMVESQQVSLSTPALTLQLRKYSRMANQLQQVDEALFTNKVNFSFPLSTASEPSERQTFSVVNFKVNPFLGSAYLNQSVLSNNSIYFAYRDQYGEYLGSQYINGTIMMSFDYTYNDYPFLPNRTVCAYIGSNDSSFDNKNCEIQFSRDQNVVNCACKHMSFYTVIEDNLIRPSVTPLVSTSFRNWPAFIVILYVILIFVIGLIYTFHKDNQDMRFLLEQDETSAPGDTLSLINYAFKRKVFFMGFSQQMSFANLYRIFLLNMHPLLQLKYKMDPQVPRFYKFLMLYTRIIIIMGICFASMHTIQYEDKYEQASGKIIIALFGQALLLIPIPMFMFYFFKAKYYLHIPSGSRGNSDYDYEKLKKLQEEIHYRRVYIDPNLPIKLLFLINAVPFSELMTKTQEKVPYASGNFRQMGYKLLELDVDLVSKRISKKSNITDSSSSMSEDPKEVLTRTRELRTRELSNLAQQFQTEKQALQQFENDDKSYLHNEKTVSHLVDHNDVNFEMDEANVDDADEEHPEYRSKATSSDEQYEGGEPEQPQSHQSNQDYTMRLHTDNRQMGRDEEDQMRSQPSESSINTEQFLDEKKELKQERNLVRRAIGIGIALVINAGIFFYVLSSFIAEQYYNAEPSDTYVWVLIFFLSQLIGFFFIDLLALWIQAICVHYCLRKKKTLLSLFMRESLTLYEDYKYVVQFTQTKVL